MGKVRFSKESACFFAGPRPKNLPSMSYDPMVTANKRILLALRDVIIDHIENKGVDTFISGMALGIDLWAARIVMKLKEDDRYSHVKLIGAVPHRGHSDKWPSDSRAEWQRVYEACEEVVYVSNETYRDGCMQVRNEWMIDHASCGIAVFNGRPGGTYNCLMYAVESGLGDRVTIISPSSLDVQEGLLKG